MHEVGGISTVTYPSVQKPTADGFVRPSCQSTVHKLLEQLEPPPKKVLSSIIDRSVTLQHQKDLSQRTIQSILRDAGFILGGDGLCGRALGFIRNLGHSQRQQVHMSYCRLCQDVQNRARLGAPGDRSAIRLSVSGKV